MLWVNKIKEDWSIRQLFILNPPFTCYDTWTRLGVSGTGTDPSVMYGNPKRSEHGDSVRDLDTGMGTLQILVIKFFF